MFFRTPRFIRRFFRRIMHPMHPNRAMSIREKLSILYMFLAWNAGGYVLYQCAKGNTHWVITKGLVDVEEEKKKLKSPAYEWAKILGIEKAQVYKFGFSSGLQRAPDIDLTVETASQSQEELKQSE